MKDHLRMLNEHIANYHDAGGGGVPERFSQRVNHSTQSHIMFI